MCGRFTQEFPEAPRALLEISALLNNWPSPARYNIAPTQVAGLVRAGEDGLERALLRWGLVPAWSKDGKMLGSTINARLESAAEKPTFRSAYRHRRCLVPMSGYYEWVETASGKQPFYLSAKDGAPLWVAGLWERWTRSETPIETFTIITRAAEGDAATIHDRMPGILPAPVAAEWITGSTEAATGLLLAAPVPELRIVQVSRRVNSARVDEASLIEPVEEPEA
jgi:putative SOS response-associated peptidase YedK